MSDRPEEIARTVRAHLQTALPDWSIYSQESAVIIETGSKVSITDMDGVTTTYAVEEGDSPGTAWVNPSVPRSLTLRRIEESDV